jgi:hypothetical protein
MSVGSGSELAVPIVVPKFVPKMEMMEPGATGPAE